MTRFMARFNPSASAVFFAALVLILAAVFLGSARPAEAATITVAAGVVDVNGADGLCSLNEAIENANDDAATHADCAAGDGADTIELAAGAVYPVTNNLGGGWGVEGVNSKLTILGHNATISEQSAGNIGLMNNYPGGDLTLRNLTLEDGSNQTTGGGAIFSSGRLMVTNVTFRNNGAILGDGGAIYVNVQSQGSTLFVLNSRFEGNHAADNGGAIYAPGDNWQFEVRNTTFTNNSASNSGGAIYFSQNPATGYISYSTFNDNDVFAGDGGAIYVAGTGGTFLLDHVTLDNNLANSSQQGAGGAIYANGSSAVELFASEVSNNSAWNGGAVVAYGGPFTVTHSAFRGNQADNLGGAIHFLSGAEGTIRYSELSGNSAGYRGGGIFLDSGISNTEVRAYHSTFSGNSSDDDGGAIFSIASVVTLTYTSLVSNSAVDSGSAIYNTGYLGTNGMLTIRNSAILDNTGSGALGQSACYNGSYGTWDSEGYNRYQNGALSGCIGLFPETGDQGVGGAASAVIDLMLADNGGRTLTHAIVNDSASHSLWNKIPPGGAQNCIGGSSQDQRGHLRAGGGGAGGTNCDIGAYEYNAQCAVPGAPDATISRSGDDILLSWNDPAGAWSIEIWRDSDPYYDPTTPGNKLPLNVLEESYTFYDETGWAPNSRYYAMRGVAGCGDVSVDVSRVGVFEFELVPGT